MEDQILVDYANQVIKTHKLIELEQKAVDWLREELQKMERELYKLLPKDKCPLPQQQLQQHPM